MALSDERLQQWLRCFEQDLIEVLSPDDCDCLEGAIRELLDARKEIECPICYGTPHASGKPCVCGGTNRAQKAVEGLQSLLFDSEQDNKRLRAIPDEVREHVGDFSWLYQVQLADDPAGAFQQGYKSALDEVKRRMREVGMPCETQD